MQNVNQKCFSVTIWMHFLISFQNKKNISDMCSASLAIILLSFALIFLKNRSKNIDVASEGPQQHFINLIDGFGDSYPSTT